MTQPTIARYVGITTVRSVVSATDVVVRNMLGTGRRGKMPGINDTSGVQCEDCDPLDFCPACNSMNLIPIEEDNE